MKTSLASRADQEDSRQEIYVKNRDNSFEKDNTFNINKNLGSDGQEDIVSNKVIASQQGKNPNDEESQEEGGSSSSSDEGQSTEKNNDDSNEE